MYVKGVVRPPGRRDRNRRCLVSKDPRLSMSSTTTAGGSSVIASRLNQHPPEFGREKSTSLSCSPLDIRYQLVASGSIRCTFSKSYLSPPHHHSLAVNQTKKNKLDVSFIPTLHLTIHQSRSAQGPDALAADWGKGAGLQYRSRSWRRASVWVAVALTARRERKLRW